MLSRISRSSVFVLSIVAFSISAQAQSSQSKPIPTVRTLLDQTGQFLRLWDSASVSWEGEGEVFDAVTEEWKIYRQARGSLAWDETRWHTAEQSISYFLLGSKLDSLQANAFEQHAAKDASVLHVGVKAKSPNEEHFQKRDFSAAFDDGGRKTVTFFDAESGITQFRQRNPRIPLLTGYDAESVSILDRYKGSPGTIVTKTRLLNRDCWRVSITKNEGTYSLSICPELSFAILEIKTELKLENVARLVKIDEVKPNWSEFVIVTQNTATREGVKSGRRSRILYKQIARPARNEAFQMVTTIPNGQPVILMDSQQIKAEWRQGKIVRIYDGHVVKELASVQMKPGPRIGIYGWLAVVVLVLICVFSGLHWRAQRNVKTG
jgi:hypothetical protein